MSQIGELQIRLKAIDEASDVVSEASRNIEASLSEVERANKAVQEAQNRTNASVRDLVTGFSGLATSAFSLYQGIDRVEKSQYALERANYLAQTALKAVEDAQSRYNQAVEKYGADSEEAQKAARVLELAQERYRLAVEKAEMAQGNLSQTMAQVALSVVPTLITGIDSGIKAFQSLHAATEAISGALNFLAANPIVLVIAGIAALASGLVYLYQTNEDFRNAINALGEALIGFFKPAVEGVQEAIKWLSGAWHAFCGTLKSGYDTFIKPVIDGLKWLSDALGSAAKAAQDALGGFKDAVSGAFSNAQKTIGDFIESICFAHAINEAVNSAEKDLERFTSLVDRSMGEALRGIEGFKAGAVEGIGAGLGVGAVVGGNEAQGPVTINLTLNASVSGEADEGRLARRVADEIASALYRRHRNL
jgi:phage-related protein